MEGGGGGGGRAVGVGWWGPEGKKTILPNCLAFLMDYTFPRCRDMRLVVMWVSQRMINCWAATNWGMGCPKCFRYASFAEMSSILTYTPIFKCGGMWCRRLWLNSILNSIDNI